jgi:hypothetical protein
MSLRILLATEAHEGLGHVWPWRGLLEILREHGHAAVMACPQASSAQGLLAKTGARIVPAWWPSMHAGAIQEPSYCWEDLLWNLGYGSNKAVAACSKYWMELLATEKPDVVLADYAPLAMVMAKAAGIPVIEAGGGFCVPPARHGQPAWLPLVYQLNPAENLPNEWAMRAQTRGQAIATAFDQALAASNRLSEFNAIYRCADFRCVTSVVELDHYATFRHSNEIKYLGALKLSAQGDDPVLSAGSWCTGAKEDRRLLCYLKETTPDIYEYLAQLAICTGWQVLIAGLNSSIARKACLVKGVTPSHIHFSEKALDFSKALPLADVFITNGGIHSLAHALSNSTHCLLIPSQAEQASTAFLLKKHPLVGIVGPAKNLSQHLIQLKNALMNKSVDEAINLKSMIRMPTDSVSAEDALLDIFKKALHGLMQLP